MQRTRGAGMPHLLAGLVVLVLVVCAMLVLFGSSSGTESDDARAATIGGAAAMPNALDAPGPADASGTAERTESAAEIAASQPASQPGALPPDATGVTGRVIGRTGKPESGVTVTMQRWVDHKDAERFGVTIPPNKNSAVYERSAESGIDGVFTIIDLVPDEGFSILATSRDGLLGRVNSVDVVSKLVRDVGDVPMVRGARVSGIVRTEGGGGVAAAEVQVGWQRRAEPITTDAQGRFDAGTIYPGRQQIRVKARGYGLADAMEREFVAGDVVTDLEITLVMSAAITGHVVDPAGRGIANAMIQCDRENDDQFMGSWSGDYQYTDVTGAFAFESTPPGKYSLWVNAEGYGYTQRENVVAGGPPIEITMQKAATIEGRVVDARTGDGVRPRKISLEWIPPWNRNDPNPTFEEYWSDIDPETQQDGRFRIGLSESGRFKVVVEADGFTKARSEPFELGAHGTVNNVLIRVEAGCVLIVTVTDKSTRAPIEGAIVELFEKQQVDPADAPNYPPDYTGVEDLANRVSRAPTDASGVAKLSALKKGDLVAIVTKRGFARARQNDVHVEELADPAPIAIALGLGGGIEGRVLNNRGGPEPALRVTANGPKGESGAAVSVEQGRYRIENLAPGRYAVAAAVEDGGFIVEKRQEDDREIPEQERFPVVVTDGAYTQHDVTVERQDAGTLAGTVLMNGIPAAGLTVMASRVETGGRRRNYFRWENQAKTDALGAFRYRRLKPGNYHLTVHRGWQHMFDGGDALVQSGIDGNITIDIALGSVTGRAVDGDGNPLAGANIQLQKKQDPSHQQMFWWGGNLAAQTDADGRFTIDDVQQGAYSLNATMRGYQRVNIESVDVVGRRSSGPFDLKMKKGGWVHVRIANATASDRNSTWYMFSMSDESGNGIMSSWQSLDADGCTWIEMPKPSGTLTVQSQNDDNLPSRTGTAPVKMEDGANAEVSVSLQ